MPRTASQPMDPVTEGVLIILQDRDILSVNFAVSRHNFCHRLTQRAKNAGLLGDPACPSSKR